MGAPVAWVLNLDADFELANRGPWEAPRALKELLDEVSKGAEHLLGPDDFLVHSLEGSISSKNTTVLDNVFHKRMRH